MAMESIRLDEDTALKAAAGNTVEGSSPSGSARSRVFPAQYVV
jgi:hypothetical protein